MNNLHDQLIAWLDKQKITSDNIGDIRRQCFMPWDGDWNSLVRDETAARENKTIDPLDVVPVDLPAYTDTDLMSFGKYVNLQLQDVPASYLLYLWTKRPISDKRLEEYIKNNRHALKQKHPDGIW